MVALGGICTTVSSPFPNDESGTPELKSGTSPTVDWMTPDLYGGVISHFSLLDSAETMPNEQQKMLWQQPQLVSCPAMQGTI